MPPRLFAEKISFYVMVGALIGARLGDLFFYQDWHEVVARPLAWIAVWEGGLASHGGAVGILVGLFLFARKYRVPFLTLLGTVVIPTSLAAVCIRIGNFMNQEIVGHPTSVPWGVLFLHPAGGEAPVPRHPVQLYEALLYLFVFGLLWMRAQALSRARLAGLFFLLVFGGRFLLERFKVEQSVYLVDGGLFTMGQWLSIPFILLGGWLFFRKEVLENFIREAE